MMKKPIVLSLLALVLIMTMGSGVFAGLEEFADAPKEDHWSYKPLKYVVDHGILKGIDGKIAGEKPLTRAQMAALMNRVLGAKETGDISKFTDVPKTAWYAEDMAKAVKLGILTGRSETKMAPEAQITREEAFTVLFRTLTLEKGQEKTLKSFADEGNIAPWAKAPIAALVEKGIVEGANGKLHPKESITRGEFAALIYRAFPHFGGPEKAGTEGVKGEKVLTGSAKVDQQQYPLIDPFVHPPFYNARVKVTLGEDGKILSVADDDTSTKGWAPGATQEFWNRKNKPYWDTLLKSGFFEKFPGKTKGEVEAMKVARGEADAVSGATESGKAVKQAVLNALEGKAGEKFLTPEETLKAEGMVKPGDLKVAFKNTLPKDFVLKLDSLCYGIYNGKEKVDGAQLKADGAELTVPANLKPGHYFVNILDESRTYRSPDFESGHGTPRHYPYFVVEDTNELKYEGGKLVYGGEFKDLLKNIEEILVVELDKEGKEVTVKDKEGKEVVKKVEVEPIGHHGTVDKGFSIAPFFKEDGSVNPAALAGKKKTPVFEEGKTYAIELHIWGYEKPLTFQYTAKDVPVMEEEKKPKTNLEVKIEPFGYTAKLALEVKDGKVLSLKDVGTDAGGSAPFWAKVSEKLAAFQGLDKKAVEKFDAVAGATTSREAVKAAIAEKL